MIARDAKGNRATSHLQIEVKGAPAADGKRTEPSPGRQSLLEPLDPETPLRDPVLAFVRQLDRGLAADSGRASLAAQFDQHGLAARQAERHALLQHARAAAEPQTEALSEPSS